MTEYIIGIFLFLGAFFVSIAALGLNRFKDVYSRLHASTKATSFGALLLLAGAGVFFGTISVWIKIVLIVVFIYLTAPLSAHYIAKSFKTKK